MTALTEQKNESIFTHFQFPHGKKKISLAIYAETWYNMFCGSWVAPHESEMIGQKR